MIDLNPNHLKTVKDILAEHVPDCEVRAFGSRVTWTAKDYSDLDLVVIAKEPLDQSTLGHLQEAFQESDLPMRVDMLDWHNISRSFRQVIERQYSTVQHSGQRRINSANTRREVALKDIATVIMGQSPPSSTYNEVGKGLPFFQGVKDFAYRCPVPRIYCDAPSRIASPGDILLSVKAPIGRVNIADRKCATGQGIAIIRSHDCEDGQYLEYWLRHVELEWHTLEDSGSVFGNATKKDLEDLALLWPNPERRRYHARILGTLDDKIELNRQTNETLEAIARVLFTSWFVDFDPVRAKMEGRDTGLPPDIAALFPEQLVDSELGEIPEGWRIVLLPEVIEINPARSLRKGEDAPYLGMANMSTKGHTPNMVIERPFGSGMRFINGDTLVARITPCLENGKIAYVDFLRDGEVGWESTEYIVMRPNPSLPNEFAYCLARSTGFRDFAIQNMTGTSGRQRVPASAMSNYQLPLPSGFEVTEVFGELVGPLFSFASQSAKESRILAAMRNSLLPRLVSGKI